MSNPGRSTFRPLLWESFLIFLSILLALFINEWRNTHNEQKRTDQIVERIEQEVASNQVFLGKMLSYHQEVFESINEALLGDSLEQAFFGQGYFNILDIAPNGIIQGNFKDVAWEVAKQDRITNRIPPELSEAIAATYLQQESVVETIDRLIGMISSREVQRRALLEESVIVLGIEFHELVSQEESLATYYSGLLEHLGEE